MAAYTTEAALLAELLGDVGRVHEQIKALPEVLDGCIDPSLAKLGETTAATKAHIAEIRATTEKEIEAARVQCEKLRLEHARHMEESAARSKMYLERTEENLSRAVVETAQKVAHHTARKRQWQWMVGGLVASFFALVGVSWFAFSSGQTAGYQEGYGHGYARAVDEEAAAAWANTPEGKMAFRLAEVGSIKDLFLCDRPGWVVQGGVCYPKADKEKVVWGWRIPTGPGARASE